MRATKFMMCLLLASSLGCGDEKAGSPASTAPSANTEPEATQPRAEVMAADAKPVDAEAPLWTLDLVAEGAPSHHFEGYGVKRMYVDKAESPVRFAGGETRREDAKALFLISASGMGTAKPLEATTFDLIASKPPDWRCRQDPKAPLVITLETMTNEKFVGEAKGNLTCASQIHGGPQADPLADEDTTVYQATLRFSGSETTGQPLGAAAD